MQKLATEDAPSASPVTVRMLGALSTIAGLLTVAMLYLGRDVLVPFALAVLLGFVLDPLVTWLRRRGLPRGASVALVTLFTVGLLGGTSLFVGSQAVQLSKDLPTYQSTIQAKLRTLRQTLTERNGLEATTRLLDVLGGEIDATRRAMDHTAQRATPPLARVQLEPAPRSAVQAATDLIGPLLAPVGTAGLVFVFVIYILLERNDLRDRLIRLVGSNLHLTTDALGEAGDRVSRYLTMQLLVNVSYGLPMAAGLALIGVPGALLWGVVAGMMRFVPYIGPAMAAAFPLALAFAVDPGWHMVIWTGVLVITLELLSNNLVEPWLYGASTGLSPVSLILSAVFWTALWGPIGLVMATPLTVCLAVLGRHIPSLEWLDIMLSSQPAFDPPTRLYQRLLAGDVEEAIDMAGTQIGASTVQAFYSECAVPALQLAANDHRRVSSVEHRLRVSTGIHALVRELRDEHPPAVTSGAGPLLLCIGARWEVDAVAADMLAHALVLDGINARSMPAGAVSAEHISRLDLAGVQGVCLSYFSPTPEAHLRYVARRLRRRQPGLQIVAALWNAPPALLAPGAAAELGVDAVVHTVIEASQCLLSRLGMASAELSPAPPATQSPAPADRAEADGVEALSMPLPAAMAQTAQRLADVFDASAAMVSLIDQTCQVWQAGKHPGRSGPSGTAQAPHLEILMEWSLGQSQPQAVCDIARDPRLAQQAALQQAGVRFVATTPLRTSAGEMVGALCVMDSEPRQLSEREIHLLETVADELMRNVPAHDPGSTDALAPPELAALAQTRGLQVAPT